ncbi:MAG: mechanosensitive ion channel [Candidatus Thermoplasmatota archaeon]|nr:mechanosensitive ion channel [Candidatus Thermoplasmatota archaeon]
MNNFAKSVLIQTCLIIGLIASISINFWVPDIDLEKIVLSLAAINVIFFFFKVVLEGSVHNRLRDYKRRYAFRKTNSLVFLILIAIILIAIWIENTQAILVAYGLLAAGIAIALQDLFKGFTGGILILLNNLYRVGDRIQIGETFGDVMDIGILYTTLMETRGWVQGDQATGRIVLVPNASVLSNAVKNYTKDHNFIWEEIVVPVTFDSNWEALIGPLLKYVKDYCADLTPQALREIEALGEKYYLPKRDVEPMIYVSFDDRFIRIGIRFVTEARKRRFHSNNIYRIVLKEAAKHADVKIAQSQVESWNLGKGP